MQHQLKLKFDFEDEKVKGKQNQMKQTEVFSQRSVRAQYRDSQVSEVMWQKNKNFCLGQFWHLI